MFVHKRLKRDFQAEKSLDRLAKAFLEQEEAEKRLMDILLLTQKARQEARTSSPTSVAQQLVDMSQALTETARANVARAKEKRISAERIAKASPVELISHAKD